MEEVATYDYRLARGEEQQAGYDCAVCGELLTINDDIAAGFCCNAHHYCALHYYSGVGPNDTRLCPGRHGNLFNPPPVTVDHVTAPAQECPICYVDDGTLTFARVCCPGRHLYHPGCLVGFARIVAIDREITMADLETWQNLPFPTSRTPCDMAELRSMEYDASLNPPDPPVITHGPPWTPTVPAHLQRQQQREQQQQQQQPEQEQEQ